MKIVQEKILTGHKAGIYALAKLPNGGFLSGAGDGWIVEWPEVSGDSEDGLLISKVDAQIFDMCFDSLRGVIWAGDMNGGVYAVDRNKKKLLNKQAHHNKGTYLLAAHGDIVLSAGADGRFTLWSPSNYLPEQSYSISKKHLRAIAFHPSKPVMAIAGGDGHIYIFHTESWKCIQQIKGAHERSVFDLLFHPDGDVLYSGGMDASLKSWDWAIGVPIKEVPAHRFTINSIAIDRSRNYLFTGSRDNSIKIWALDSLELLKVIDERKKSHHMNSVNIIEYHQTPKTIISASDDRTIRMWKIFN